MGEQSDLETWHHVGKLKIPQWKVATIGIKIIKIQPGGIDLCTKESSSMHRNLNGTAEEMKGGTT